MANKQDLIAKVAETAELSKKQAALVVNTVFETISESLSNGEKVQIIGFGSFDVRERAERKGHNPQTGKELVIPASKVPGFKAGKALKEVVK